MELLTIRPNLIFVGQIHGKKEAVPSEAKVASKEYGAWYEGNGEDKVDGIQYKGSWDDALGKEVNGYPKEFLFVIFTNTAVNRQKEILPGFGTIFDRILKTQSQYGYFKDRKFGADTLTAFLKEMGESYLKNSKAEATKKNVADFISSGEKDMWESGNTPARKMADKANKYRDTWLLSRSKGVYFTGSDHLKNLKFLHHKKNSTIEKKDVNQINSRLI